jgi:charged multivesicular body protein 6
LKTGSAALKKVHDILSIDEIEKIMDESREGIEKQREIDELISGELTEEDEEAVEAELEAILDVEDQLPDVPADKLPEVPEGKLADKPRKTKESPSKIAIEA